MDTRPLPRPAIPLAAALLIALSPSAFANDMGRAAAEPESVAARDGAPKRSGRKAEEGARSRILDRIELDCDDPTTCWFGELPETGEPTVDALTAEQLDGLLREILSGLEAHDDDSLRVGEEELRGERDDELAYFGASDHAVDPPIDWYDDPLTALRDRPPLYLDQVDLRDFDIPIVLNQRTQAWMVYFLTRGRIHFVRWLARSERYVPLLRKALGEAGLPRDLVYQAMIESGFNPYATSSAKAVGVWQFMPRTGLQYGLAYDWWVDERRDPTRATAAAIRYLKYLYGMFGRWELACAAYNAGEGKMQRAIAMYDTKDFWELTDESRSYLRSETKHYVPKIMAAAVLSKYADRWKLREEILDADRLSAWDFDVVPVEEATDLSLAAKLANVDPEFLASINPHLRRGYTPPGVANYPLYLPKGTGEVFAEAYSKLPEDEKITFVRHKVERGQSLSAIANRYSVPQSAIMAINHISDARKLRTGEHLIIPVKPGTVEQRTLEHVVSSGDTLGGIAGKYGLSVAELKDLNGLRSDTIQPGQRLLVKAAVSALAVEEDKPASASSKATSYTVRSGDTLSQIAERHGTSSAELRRLNGLSGDTIHVGDVLKVKGEAKVEARGSDTKTSEETSTAPRAAVATYRVRSGDVLGSIAERHGMSISDLMSLNSLRSSRIYVGQELKVRGARGAAAEPRSTEAKAADGTEPKSTTRATTHTVRSGEVLGTIAEKYGVSVTELMRWNGLSSSNIQVGQSLKLSGSAGSESKSTTKSYTVRSGDTLWDIAQKLGVSVDDLKRWNGIRGSAIKAGQRLVVKG